MAPLSGTRCVCYSSVVGGALTPADALTSNLDERRDG